MSIDRTVVYVRVYNEETMHKVIDKVSEGYEIVSTSARNHGVDYVLVKDIEILTIIGYDVADVHQLLLGLRALDTKDLLDVIKKLKDYNELSGYIREFFSTDPAGHIRNPLEMHADIINILNKCDK